MGQRHQALEDERRRREQLEQRLQDEAARRQKLVEKEVKLREKQFAQVWAAGTQEEDSRGVCGGAGLAPTVDAARAGWGCISWPKERSPSRSSSSLPRQARPLTRYLPIRKDDFDLRSHIESSGHSVDTCSHVILSDKVCRGYLVKMGARSSPGRSAGLSLTACGAPSRITRVRPWWQCHPSPPFPVGAWAAESRPPLRGRGSGWQQGAAVTLVLCRSLGGPPWTPP